MIPENTTDFLYWFKEITELYWSDESSFDKSDEDLGVYFNAKWIGMDSSQIDALEVKFDVKFPEDFREFLRILHPVDKFHIIGIMKLKFYQESIILDKVCFFDKYWSNSWGKCRNSDLFYK